MSGIGNIGSISNDNPNPLICRLLAFSFADRVVSGAHGVQNGHHIHQGRGTGRNGTVDIFDGPAAGRNGTSGVKDPISGGTRLPGIGAGDGNVWEAHRVLCPEDIAQF